MGLFSDRRSTGIFLLTLILLELLLVAYYVPSVEGKIKKRKLMRKIRKLKEMLPLLLALKAKKKKIILLPIPFPMKGGMMMPSSEPWPMPEAEPWPMQTMNNFDPNCDEGAAYGGNGGGW